MSASRVGFLIATYLLGSIPTGYWLGRAWKGIDIRQYGSGNLGATNVYRVLGAKPALFTFTIDCLKGLIPVLLAKHLFPDELSMAALAGVIAILGHTMSVFVHFRGGKGMATSTGVFAALMPEPCAGGHFGISDRHLGDALRVAGLDPGRFDFGGQFFYLLRTAAFGLDSGRAWWPSLWCGSIARTFSVFSKELKIASSGGRKHHENI